MRVTLFYIPVGPVHTRLLLVLLGQVSAAQVDQNVVKTRVEVVSVYPTLSVVGPPLAILDALFVKRKVADAIDCLAQDRSLSKKEAPRYERKLLD